MLNLSFLEFLDFSRSKSKSTNWLIKKNFLRPPYGPDQGVAGPTSGSARGVPLQAAPSPAWPAGWWMD